MFVECGKDGDMLRCGGKYVVFMLQNAIVSGVKHAMAECNMVDDKCLCIIGKLNGKVLFGIVRNIKYEKECSYH